MKKVLVSLLVGMTLCGGLFGCGNKEVEETKIETKTEVESTYEDEEDKVVEEQSKEEIVEGVLDSVRNMHNNIDSQMNESSEYFFSYSEITYDSYTNTVVIKNYMNSKDGDDNQYVMAMSMSDTSDLFTSMKENCDMDYEVTRNLLNLNGITDVDITVAKYMGAYKVFETKNGEVVYTIQ